MMMNNNRKKLPQNRKKDFHKQNNHHNNHNNNYHGNNNNNHQSQQSNNSNNNNHSYQPKRITPTILSIHDYQKAPVFGPLDLPLPYLYPKQPSTHKFNEIPSIQQRPPAKLQSTILQSTFYENLTGLDPSRKANEAYDPAVKIVLKNRQNAKKFKLGGLEIDIYKKNNILQTSTLQTSGNGKLINKFLQNESLSTPLKRNRDEIVDASSSIKKNKRLTDIQQDTSSMELSFEGKAMDKNDYVKLVDSSGIMADDSILPNENQNPNNQQLNNFDTKNLLQNTEFSFEFKK